MMIGSLKNIYIDSLIEYQMTNISLEDGKIAKNAFAEKDYSITKRKQARSLHNAQVLI